MYDLTQVRDVFKQLTDDIKADLDYQYRQGRLKGTDYANVYTQLMQTALQLSFEAPIREQQVLEIASKRAVNDARVTVELNTATKVARETSLVQAQIERTVVERDYELKKQKDLLPEQIKKTKAEIDMILRQIKGMNDDVLLKLLDSQLSSWAIMFNSGLLETAPAIIKDDQASALYNTIKENLDEN